MMKIDTASLLEKKIITGAPAKNLVAEMRWEIGGRRGLPKNNMIILDLIDGNSSWERPIYFAITASRDNYLGLEKYLHREGLAYRLLPSTGKENDLFSGSVNTDVMYDNVMNKFRWGGIEDTTLFIDENVQRMLSNFRYTFASLANALVEEGKKDSAVHVLDTCQRLMPNNVLPYNASILPIIQIYYTMGEMDKANTILLDYSVIIDQELTYYREIHNFSQQKFSLIAGDYNFSYRALYNLHSLASNFGQNDMVERLMGLIQKHESRMKDMFQF